MNEMSKEKEEKLVKKLKEKPGVENPWALAKSIKNKQEAKPKKEGVEDGSVSQVYAVQKPYSGCQLTSLIQPIDPLVGLGGSEITSDKVHGVYPDEQTAQRMAETLYKEFELQEKALEEKKLHVIDRIKETIDELEKQRAESVNMIKENPKDASSHKEKVAHIATKMDHLVTQLQRIEASKKEIEKDDKKKHDKKDEKKKVEEALVRALKEKKEDEADKSSDKPKKLDRDTTIYINKSELKGKTKAEFAKHKLERQGYKVDSSVYDQSKQQVKIKSYGKLTYHPIKVTGDKDEKKPIRTIYK